MRSALRSLLTFWDYGAFIDKKIDKKIDEAMMQWFTIRPTFELRLPFPSQQVLNHLAQECKKIGRRDSFLLHGEYGELHLPSREHRLWSPHLSFYVVDKTSSTDATQTVIHGRFAPRVDVWTCVWIAYLLAIFTAFFASILAYSQWMLKQPMWGLWLTIAAMLGLLTIYVVAHIGQQWSADQMMVLRQRLEDLLADLPRSAVSNKGDLSPNEHWKKEDVASSV